MNSARLGRAAALLIAAMTAGVAGPVAAASAVQRCAAPPRLVRFAAPLPHAAERIRKHELLRIVAIGSSSTSGVGASAPARSYPARLAALLAARLPHNR